MKKILFCLLLALLVCTAAGVCSAEEGNHALVVYFDYSENMGNLTGMTVDAITSASLNAATDNIRGNLQVMAQAIQEQTSSEVFPIHVVETHTVRYLDMVDGAGEDQDNNRAFTVLDLPENFDSYDTIYFGTPVWHGQLPQPVASFLGQVDWSGKRVIAFGIHLGSGWGRNLSQIQELQPSAEVVEGITVYASDSNDEVRHETLTWLNEIAPASQTAIRMTFGDGTVGYMTDIRNHATAQAFLDMLPKTERFSNLDGREYWYSETLPYDEDSVQHTYAIGEFTYWCGGWVTAYYNTNEDTVIEAGSVVIGKMDDTAVQQFVNANGAPQEITFEIAPLSETQD